MRACAKDLSRIKNIDQTRTRGTRARKDRSKGVNVRLSIHATKHQIRQFYRRIDHARSQTRSVQLRCQTCYAATKICALLLPSQKDRRTIVTTRQARATRRRNRRHKSSTSHSFGTQNQTKNK